MASAQWQVCIALVGWLDAETFVHACACWLVLTVHPPHPFTPGTLMVLAPTLHTVSLQAHPHFCLQLTYYLAAFYIVSIQLCINSSSSGRQRWQQCPALVLSVNVQQPCCRSIMTRHSAAAAAAQRRPRGFWSAACQVVCECRRYGVLSLHRRLWLQMHACVNVLSTLLLSELHK